MSLTRGLREQSKMNQMDRMDYRKTQTKKMRSTILTGSQMKLSQMREIRTLNSQMTLPRKKARMSL